LIGDRGSHDGPVECRWQHKVEIEILMRRRPAVPLEKPTETLPGRDEDTVELVPGSELMHAICVDIAEVPAPVALRLVTCRVDPQDPVRPCVRRDAFWGARAAAAVSAT